MRSAALETEGSADAASSDGPPQSAAGNAASAIGREAGGAGSSEGPCDLASHAAALTPSSGTPGSTRNSRAGSASLGAAGTRASTRLSEDAEAGVTETLNPSTCADADAGAAGGGEGGKPTAEEAAAAAKAAAAKAAAAAFEAAAARDARARWLAMQEEEADLLVHIFCSL